VVNSAIGEGWINQTIHPEPEVSENMKTKTKDKIEEVWPPDEPELEVLLRDIISVIARKTPEPFIDFRRDSANFEFKVHTLDHGRFVGKHGVTIFALKTIFWYAGLVVSRRTIGLNLLEPEYDPTVDKRSLPFRPNKSWDRRLIHSVCEKLIEYTLGECVSAVVIEEIGETEAIVNFTVESNLKTAISEPDLIEALSIVIHAIGMSQGVSLKNNVTWN
jgi:hypothetical protein